jgi:hypothetical protein
MGNIKRHTQVESTKLADGALDTVDIKDASVTPAKFSVLQEYGTVAAVTATGTYLTFDTAFSAAPTVVVTGIDAAARLANAPVAGSAKIELGAAGTAVVHYIAWGAR